MPNNRVSSINYDNDEYTIDVINDGTPEMDESISAVARYIGLQAGRIYKNSAIENTYYISNIETGIDLIEIAHNPSFAIIEIDSSHNITDRAINNITWNQN